MACFELKPWLTEYYPRLNWKHDFGAFLSADIVQKASQQKNGFTYFVKALNAEFVDQDAEKALGLYHEGAKYLDPLCLFRLHELSLGNSFFNTEYDEVKSIVYLLWSAQFVLDINVRGPVNPIKKLVKFLIGFDKSGEYSVNLIMLCDDSNISASKEIVKALFLRNYFNNTDKKENEECLISALSSLAKRSRSARKMFTMVHIGITRCYWATIKEKNKARVILRTLLKPEIVDNAFTFQKVLLDICLGNEGRMRMFCDWLAVFTFFWEYAFLSPNKGQHLKYLCKISDILIKKKLMKDEINIWWVKFYTGYSFEKGYLGGNNEDKALEIYQSSIKSHESGLFPPLRTAILLKKHGKIEEAEEAFIKFRDNFMKRNKEEHPCFFNYVMGKAYEKYLGSEVEAIIQYDKGATAESRKVSEYLVMFNEYWRTRCEKRREKLLKRAKLEDFDDFSAEEDLPTAPTLNEISSSNSIKKDDNCL